MRRVLSSFICLLLVYTYSFAQIKTITGKVTDETGSPLPGATVSVVGARGTAVTNTLGAFTLPVSTGARQLQVTFVGFSTQTLTIGSQNTFTVVLTPAVGSLTDVVVTGITRVKKTEYAGAAAHVSREAVADKPVGSFDQLLQGQAPGLLALTGSGQPGNSTTVILRGQSSVAGGSNPLYIIDGIPVEAGVFQGLNPNDFESLDILRDASASALYGSRGSAGVIVVTTRRGSGGKMKFSYNAQFGIKSKPDFAFRPMNTTELLRAQEDYGRVLGIAGSASIPGWYYSKNNPRYATLTPAGQTAATTTLDSLSKINTDWRDVFFRSGPFSNHQISLSGGSGKTRVYSSLEYYNENGTTSRTDMKRVSLRNNVDYSDDKFNFSLSSSLAYVKRNFQQSATTNSTQNPFLVTNINAPYSLVYRPDGTLATGNGASFVGADVLDYTMYDRNYNNQLKANLGITASYKLTPDIVAAVTAGLDFRETQGSVYGSKLAYLRTISSSVITKAGSQQETLNRFFSPDIRPSINFNKTIAERHKVNVGVYGEYISQFGKTLTLTGYGIDPRTPNTPAAITQGDANNQLYAVVGGSKTQNALYSGLAVGSYTFDEKYTVTGSYRSDGSSKLAKGNKWQDFYSMGAVWNATKENFISNIPQISTLRLRASYGGSGNNDNFPTGFGDYGSLATYGANGNYSGLTTLYVTNVGNADLKWERTYVLNLGLDYSLFNNRIYGNFELYDKRTKDMFVTKQLSAEAGGYTVLVNGGQLQNKGFEFDVNVDLVKTKDITWTVNGKGGYNRNRVLSLAGLPSYASGTSLIKIGLPLGAHYEVKWAGVDAATGAPLYYKADGKTITSTYSTDDKVQQFGTWEAPWRGGFGSSLRFMDFNLSALFTWQHGASKTDNLEYFVENPVGFLAGGYNQSSSLNFWKKPGDIASTPSPVYGTNFSSKIIHDASFVRFRDITLTYTLPRTVTNSVKFISRAQAYVQGTNLLIWTKWRGMDPEAGPNNINLSEYPNPRAITGGLNITF